jgi:hypothetical protein
MLRSLAIILVPLGLATAGSAQEARVKIVLRSDNGRVFEHRTTVRGAESHRLASPSPADLAPYVTAAQKALAERNGYAEGIFGGSNNRLASGRLVESAVEDAGGRTLWSSRPPLESESRRSSSVARATFEAPEPDAGDDSGFAERGKGAVRRGHAQKLMRMYPFVGR